MSDTQSKRKPLAKCATGIGGLDAVTCGGLPRGRISLVLGGPGSGKTLLGHHFLLHGIMAEGEPGAFITFEESQEELAANAAALGWDLPALEAAGSLALDQVVVDSAATSGDFDLEALFIRIDAAIRESGATRVVLDSLSSLLAGLSPATVRRELARLFRWLKERRMTTLVTSEVAEVDGHSLEEYISDCVLILDHRIEGQLATRRLRVAKYRGSSHGTNEYPFLIDGDGIAVLPITSVGLEYPAGTERVSSGVPRLDTMLGGGFFRGSSILVSGTAGTGKSSLAASFAEAACARGERALYLTLEESPDQIVRNMRSIGIELAPWLERGALHIEANRASRFGLEHHLVNLYRLVRERRPEVVVIDPVSNLLTAGDPATVKGMLTRVIDLLKSQGITAFYTDLNRGLELERSSVDVSSLMDSWLLLREVPSEGERNRVLQVIKSRGTRHSNQIREFLLSDNGIELVDVYVGPGGVVTGAARLTREAEERAEAEAAARRLARLERRLARTVETQEKRLKEMQVRFESEREALQDAIGQQRRRAERLEENRRAMARQRLADGDSGEEP